VVGMYPRVGHFYNITILDNCKNKQLRKKKIIENAKVVKIGNIRGFVYANVETADGERIEYIPVSKYATWEIIS
jgi:hypothetical protein